MTLRDMMYIRTIAEEKSITKASVRLFVAQPALSQCVQKVEKELGTPVFVRTTVGVTLTAEGQCFMDFVKKTLQEQKNFEKRVKDLKNAEKGEIYLGFTGTQATYVLPYFLPQFKEEYPSIEIVLVEATSDEIEHKLVKGEIDVGILHPPFTSRNLDHFEISRDEMVIIPRNGSRFQPFDGVGKAGQIIGIMASSAAFGYALTVEKVPALMANFFVQYIDSVFVFFLITFLIVLIFGCFLEVIAIIVLVTPILLPVATAMGVDPIHFGMFMCLTLCLGGLTPPVGLCLITTTRIADVDIDKMFPDLLYCILIYIAVIALVAAFPQLSTFLPGLMA